MAARAGGSRAQRRLRLSRVRRPGILVFARLSSRRLPGKVLMDIAGRPMLEHVLQRLRRVPGGPRVVVATSDAAEDRAIAEFALAHGVGVHRGALANVAARALAAAKAHDFDVFVRISADSPFIDPAMVGEALARHAEERPDLTTNVFPRSYPPGCSVEVVEQAALARALPEMNAEEQEHVTLHFYRRPADWRIVNLASSGGGHDGVHLAVDTPRDLARARAIAAALGAEPFDAGLARVAALARAYDRRSADMSGTSAP